MQRRRIDIRRRTMFSRLSGLGAAIGVVCLVIFGAYRTGFLQEAGSLVGIGAPRTEQAARPDRKPDTRVVVRNARPAIDPSTFVGPPSPEARSRTVVGGITIPRSAQMGRAPGTAVAAATPAPSDPGASGSSGMQPVSSPNGFAGAFSTPRTRSTIVSSTNRR